LPALVNQKCLILKHPSLQPIVKIVGQSEKLIITRVCPLMFDQHRSGKCPVVAESALAAHATLKMDLRGVPGRVRLSTFHA
jgi:hypothetical protein